MRRQTRRGNPCETEGREGGDASISRGTPMLASKPPETQGEAWKILPQPSDGALAALSMAALGN